MHLAQQKTLILKPRNKNMEEQLIKVLSSLNISYTFTDSYDDIKNILFREKYESLLLFLNKINTKILDKFFEEIHASKGKEKK